MTGNALNRLVIYRFSGSISQIAVTENVECCTVHVDRAVDLVCNAFKIGNCDGCRPIEDPVPYIVGNLFLSSDRFQPHPGIV